MNVSDPPISTPPQLSVILPAWNESRLIAGTISSVLDAASACNLAIEILVVDDASNDDTASVARAAGATVVSVNERCIARVRNSGAAVANAPWLLFVDADTQVNADVLQAAVNALNEGAVAGGCAVRFDRPVPLWASIGARTLLTTFRWLKLMAGCFVFCRRDAFETIGGFDPRIHASEEVDFARRIRSHGRVVILREHVVTSGRKVDLVSLRTMVRLGLRGIRGSAAFHDRRGLEAWYGEGLREADHPADAPARKSDEVR